MNWPINSKLVFSNKRKVAWFNCFTNTRNLSLFFFFYQSDGDRSYNHMSVWQYPKDSWDLHIFQSIDKAACIIYMTNGQSVQCWIVGAHEWIRAINYSSNLNHGLNFSLFHLIPLLLSPHNTHTHINDTNVNQFKKPSCINLCGSLYSHVSHSGRTCELWIQTALILLLL